MTTIQTWGRRSFTHKNHRGVYNLVIRFNHACNVRIRKNLLLALKPGLFIYTGSARGHGSTSLEARLRRHLRHDKKHFWHIDRVLHCRSAKVVTVIFAETSENAECKLNTALMRDPQIRAFSRRIGSSDCGCRSHLLVADRSLRLVVRHVRRAYGSVGLAPHVVYMFPVRTCTPSACRLKIVR